MKRRPSTQREQLPGRDAYNVTRPRPRRPEDIADAIDPFLSAGGATAFLLFDEIGFDPRPAGTQLLAAQYMPPGKTGWLKQIRVAPYCPPALANPWQGWPGTWQGFEPVGLLQDTSRASAQASVYTTPMGWESYIDTTGTFIPQWHWWLASVEGTLQAARGNVGPFDLLDPLTWFLALDVPVPQSVYANGYPGSAVAGALAPQRMQVIQGDAVDWHVNVPENTTLLLFCSWRQSQVSVRSQTILGQDLVTGPLYPLLPSFGQLSGYMQRANNAHALQNARNGW